MRKPLNRRKTIDVKTFTKKRLDVRNLEKPSLVTPR
jgi:hypothetical protein